tara:strand:+ start:20426 stop:21031 length:606 start_codon:yes stop_codon:yes gene_type:complete
MMMYFKVLEMCSMFFSRRLSLEEARNKINAEYINARHQLSTYQHQMPEIYHAPVERFIENMDALHAGACVPSAALIQAIQKTEGFLKGEVTSEAYGRVIHDMNRGRSASYEPSRLSQAMVTLSWAVWVLSLVCLLAGALLLGIIGLFASYAIHHDAMHTEVKYPNAHAQHNSTHIGEAMEQILNMEVCGVAAANNRLYAPA